MPERVYLGRALFHSRRLAKPKPFKRNKRIGELDEIQDQMASEVLTPHKAAKRLWTFYEDELHLSEGSGIYQQTITLNGEQKLADVARLGMVMMFFQTPNERYGRVVKQGGEWHYQVLSDPAAKDRVKNLFASFRKQIRTGYFPVPNTLTGGEGLG